jgi:hypothetical protein
MAGKPGRKTNFSADLHIKVEPNAKSALQSIANYLGLDVGPVTRSIIYKELRRKGWLPKIPKPQPRQTRLTEATDEDLIEIPLYE